MQESLEIVSGETKETNVGNYTIKIHIIDIHGIKSDILRVNLEIKEPSAELSSTNLTF